jgi:hypothetical protein
MPIGIANPNPVMETMGLSATETLVSVVAFASGKQRSSRAGQTGRSWMAVPPNHESEFAVDDIVDCRLWAELRNEVE